MQKVQNDLKRQKINLDNLDIDRQHTSSLGVYKRKINTFSMSHKGLELKVFSANGKDKKV